MSQTGPRWAAGTNLAVRVDARDEAVKVEQVKRCAESVTERGQPGRLQVLQLTHEGGMVLLPAGLKFTPGAINLYKTGAVYEISDRDQDRSILSDVDITTNMFFISLIAIININQCHELVVK